MEWHFAPFHTLSSFTQQFSYADYTMRILWNILWEEEAATAVEYAVLLAMILLTIIGTIGMVGGETQGMWGSITRRP